MMAYKLGKKITRIRKDRSFPEIAGVPIARNLGQYFGGGCRVTSKMAPKQYKEMKGKRLFFQNSCLRMGYSFAAWLEMHPESVKASIATKKKYSKSSPPFPKVYE